MDIEKEIQQRIEFKMNEILTAIENAAKINWGSAFITGSQKEAHYWEAFKQMSDMLKKEMRMQIPYDDMAEAKRKEKRDIAIEKIMKKLVSRGERDYHQKAKFLVQIIEDAQDL